MHLIERCRDLRAARSPLVAGAWLGDRPIDGGCLTIGSPSNARGRCPGAVRPASAVIAEQALRVSCGRTPHSGVRRPRRGECRRLLDEVVAPRPCRAESRSRYGGGILERLLPVGTHKGTVLDQSSREALDHSRRQATDAGSWCPGHGIALAGRWARRGHTAHRLTVNHNRRAEARAGAPGLFATVGPSRPRRKMGSRSARGRRHPCPRSTRVSWAARVSIRA